MVEGMVTTPPGGGGRRAEWWPLGRRYGGLFGGATRCPREALPPVGLGPCRRRRPGVDPGGGVAARPFGARRSSAKTRELWPVRSRWSSLVSLSPRVVHLAQPAVRDGGTHVPQDLTAAVAEPDAGRDVEPQPVHLGPGCKSRTSATMRLGMASPPAFDRGAIADVLTIAASRPHGLRETPGPVPGQAGAHPRGRRSTSTADRCRFRCATLQRHRRPRSGRRGKGDRRRLLGERLMRRGPQEEARSGYDLARRRR
jgi:hypothetical protein